MRLWNCLLEIINKNIHLVIHQKNCRKELEHNLISYGSNENFFIKIINNRKMSNVSYDELWTNDF